MSKKKRAAKVKPPEKQIRGKLTKSMMVAITICVVASGAALSRWEPLRRNLGLPPITSPQPQSSGNLSLAKEYIYAGGRLIATEEPAGPTPSPTPSGATPTNMDAFVEEAPGINIKLQWAAPTGTVSHYVIERAGRGGVITLNTTQPVTTFTDTTTLENHVYRYRVQAVFAGGGTSGFSNGDLATTFFQNTPVVAGQTLIRATHFTDLLDAVNDVRLIAGLAPASWSTPAPVSGGRVSGAHVDELRLKLEEALAQLNVTQPPNYSDASPLSGKPIMAKHITELRARVK